MAANELDNLTLMQQHLVKCYDIFATDQTLAQADYILSNLLLMLASMGANSAAASGGRMGSTTLGDAGRALRSPVKSGRRFARNAMDDVFGDATYLDPREYGGNSKLTGWNAPKGTASAGNSNAWSQRPWERGRTIENAAAAEYRANGWFVLDDAAAAKNFPLVDFQKGNTLVSLKTVDTAGKAWMPAMKTHIRDLATRGATVDGKAANMVLDLRVPPGGAPSALPLVEYGAKRGVTVRISEFR